MSKSDALDSSIGLELLNGRVTWVIWKNRKLETILCSHEMRERCHRIKWVSDREGCSNAYSCWCHDPLSCVLTI